MDKGGEEKINSEERGRRNGSSPMKDGRSLVSV